MARAGGVLSAKEDRSYAAIAFRPDLNHSTDWRGLCPLFFNYIRNHWDALNVFISDGALPIDNNQVERLMKRVAIGRKNWLFIGSLRAGIRNASLMSLVASALRMDLDVGLCLESVVTHMTRGTAKIEELLPDRWKGAHPHAVREYREQERRDKADTAIVQAARRRV